MFINDFIYKYFIHPYRANLGYNYVNTLTYGLLFILCLLGIYKLLKSLRYNVSEKSIYATIPFIFFGSTLRVLEDAGILPKTQLLVTPFLYVWVTIITLIVVIILKKYSKKFEKNFFIIGVVFWVFTLLFYRIRNITALIMLLGVYSAVILFLIFIRKSWRLLRDNINFLALSSHMLDATATFISVDFFGYWEQHPLTRLVGTLGGSFVWFYLLKLYVLIVLYYIDRDVKDESFKNLLKLGVIILGLGPGLRDFFRLVMGV